MQNLSFVTSPLLRCFSRLMANAIIAGGRWIRTTMSSISWCKATATSARHLLVTALSKSLCGILHAWLPTATWAREEGCLMSTLVSRTAILVRARQPNGPGGKHRGRCSRLWTRISGRCLRRRGVRFSAPADRGLPSRRGRRSGAALVERGAEALDAVIALGTTVREVGVLHAD